MFSYNKYKGEKQEQKKNKKNNRKNNNKKKQQKNNWKKLMKKIQACLISPVHLLYNNVCTQYYYYPQKSSIESKLKNN